jgi:PAS domain S-box-containing protein
MFSTIKIRLLILMIFILTVVTVFIGYLHNKEKIFLNTIQNEGNISFKISVIDQIRILNIKDFSEEDLALISKNTNSILKIIPPDKKEEIQKVFSNQQSHNYAFINILVYNLNQNRILFAQKESTNLKNIKSSIDKERTLVTIAFLVFGVIILLTLHLQVVNPISTIITSFVNSQPEKLSKLRKSKSEFGVFSNFIKEFFDQKKTLEEEIKVRKITQEELETLNDELEKRVTDRTEELAVTNLELQKERDQTKQYLDIAGTIIAILDSDGYVLMMNKKGDEALGYQAAELLGKNWYKTCVHPSNRGNFIKMHKEIMRGKVASVDFTIGDVITKAGEVKTFIFHKTFLKDGEPKNSSLLFSAEDITELKIKEKELIDAKEKADESNRLKSTFLANMSHELRTPMIGILGYSDLLINELKEVKLNKMAVAIHDSGQRLIDTLNLILDLSRLEANKHNIDYQIVNLNSLVKDVTFHFEAAASRKKLFLKTSIPTYEIVARTDPRMIRDIMNNLINNAIKFTVSGGVFITLEVFLKDFIIKIKDTGIGIPEKSRHLIFEEFRQVSEGLGRGFQGTGLGLTICKKYAELLGGEISVYSIPDEGSEFSFKIPLYTEESEIRNELEVEVDEKSEEFDINQNILITDKTAKHKILIVEDDETSRDIIFLFLKNYYDLSFAENGEQAIELSNKTNFKVILMDINLGSGITGIETKDAIRKITGYINIPIIAATAFAMLGDKEKFLESGFDYYISKPYLKHQLIKVLNEIIQ